METVACVLPEGTLLAYHAPLPAYAKSPPLDVNTVPAVTELAHTKSLLWTAQRPLLEVSVNPPVPPDAVAVKVAQVPPMYHVPALMMQPEAEAEVVTWRVPLPEKGVPGEVVVVGVGLVVVPVVVVLAVGAVEPVLGRYFTPVAGQSDVEPSEWGG